MDGRKKLPNHQIYSISIHVYSYAHTFTTKQRIHKQFYRVGDGKGFFLLEKQPRPCSTCDNLCACVIPNSAPPKQDIKPYLICDGYAMQTYSH